MIYVCEFESPMGPVMAASDGESITGLWLEGQKYYAATMDQEKCKKLEEKELPVFGQLGNWLDIYFGGKNPDFMPPLAPRGSGFREDVWEILSRIPYGQVTTYGKIAKQLEIKYQKRQSAQAVGGAVGHNPISILIPCHRVVGTNGSLTGYAGGIDKKIQLLKLEKVDMKPYFIPKKGTALL